MSRTRESPKILIIAGPNGAGKTTFATEYLNAEGDCPRFVNADLIASGLNPFDPASATFQASRLMIESIEELTDRGCGFVRETTLSGRVFRHWIPSWQRAEYCIAIHFLRLRSSSLAIPRVAGRVRGGGHYERDDIVRKRYAKGWESFVGVYRDLVDEWTIYDTSGVTAVVHSSSLEKARVANTIGHNQTERKHELDRASEALRRAAKVAHRRAVVRGDKVAIWKPDRVIWIDPIVDP